MFEIQREIGVKQRIWSKFSACGGPNKGEGIKTIDFEIGLKKIPGTPKSKKNTVSHHLVNGSLYYHFLQELRNPLSLFDQEINTY